METRRHAVRAKAEQERNQKAAQGEQRQQNDQGSYILFISGFQEHSFD